MMAPSVAEDADGFFGRGSRGDSLGVWLRCCQRPVQLLCTTAHCAFGQCWLQPTPISSKFDALVSSLRVGAYSINAAMRCRCATLGMVQSLSDVPLVFDGMARFAYGRGCATCPVAAAAVPQSNPCGRGEWLYPRGSGRFGDMAPPIPGHSTAGGRLILYLHGGAFMVCSHATHRLITFELVRRTGCVVLAPAHGRPPHARHPAQLRALLALYERLLKCMPCPAASSAGRRSLASASAGTMAARTSS